MSCSEYFHDWQTEQCLNVYAANIQGEGYSTGTHNELNMWKLLRIRFFFLSVSLILYFNIDKPFDGKILLLGDVNKDLFQNSPSSGYFASMLNILDMTQFTNEATFITLTSNILMGIIISIESDNIELGGILTNNFLYHD